VALDAHDTTQEVWHHIAEVGMDGNGATVVQLHPGNRRHRGPIPEAITDTDADRLSHERRQHRRDRLGIRRAEELQLDKAGTRCCDPFPEQPHAEGTNETTTERRPISETNA
jgi:hypothetical protein